MHDYTTTQPPQLGSHTASCVQPHSHAVTQPHSHAVTQSRSHAATQPRSHAATQPRSHAAVQPYIHTSIQPYSHTAIQPYRQEPLKAAAQQPAHSHTARLHHPRDSSTATELTTVGYAEGGIGTGRLVTIELFSAGSRRGSRTQVVITVPAQTWPQPSLVS